MIMITELSKKFQKGWKGDGSADYEEYTLKNAELNARISRYIRPQQKPVKNMARTINGGRLFEVTVKDKSGRIVYQYFGRGAYNPPTDAGVKSFVEEIIRKYN